MTVTNPGVELAVASFAAKRTKKIAGLIDTAPPLRPDQIADLMERLEKHPTIDAEPKPA